MRKYLSYIKKEKEYRTANRTISNWKIDIDTTEYLE